MNELHNRFSSSSALHSAIGIVTLVAACTLGGAAHGAVVVQSFSGSGQVRAPDAGGWNQYAYLTSPIAPSGNLQVGPFGDHQASVKWAITRHGVTINAIAAGPMHNVSSVDVLFGWKLVSDRGQNIQYRWSDPNGILTSGGFSTNGHIRSFNGVTRVYNGSLVWTDDGSWPGEREKPREYSEAPGYSPGVSIPENVAASELVHLPDGYGLGPSHLNGLPVDGAYGVSDPVYFGPPNAASAAAALPLSIVPSAIGYYFQSVGDPLFTSFTALVAGAGIQKELRVGFNWIECR